MTMTRLRAPAGGAGVRSVIARSSPGLASRAAWGTPWPPVTSASRAASRRGRAGWCRRAASRCDSPSGYRVRLRRPLDLESGRGRPSPGARRRSGSTTDTLSPARWRAAGRPRCSAVSTGSICSALRKWPVQTLRIASSAPIGFFRCSIRLPQTTTSNVADRLRRDLVDAELAALGPGAEQLLGDLEAAAGPRLAAAGDRGRARARARAATSPSRRHRRCRRRGPRRRRGARARS